MPPNWFWLAFFGKNNAEINLLWPDPWPGRASSLFGWKDEDRYHQSSFVDVWCLFFEFKKLKHPTVHEVVILKLAYSTSKKVVWQTPCSSDFCHSLCLRGGPAQPWWRGMSMSWPMPWLMRSNPSCKRFRTGDWILRYRLYCYNFTTGPANPAKSFQHISSFSPGTAVASWEVGPRMWSWWGCSSNTSHTENGLVLILPFFMISTWSFLCPSPTFKPTSVLALLGPWSSSATRISRCACWRHLHICSCFGCLRGRWVVVGRRMVEKL